MHRLIYLVVVAFILCGCQSGGKKADEVPMPKVQYVE
jgi:hypothetical protein